MAEPVMDQFQVGVGARRSRRTLLDWIDEPSAEVRAAERKTARVRYRTYCIACGRCSESATVPPRLGRCTHCAGTMLVEPVTT